MKKDITNMNTEYNSPEWEGLPPFTEHNIGYSVKLLDKTKNTWLGVNKWNTIQNSYGHSWTYKGFAINCAEGWIRRWGNHTPNSLYACVVDVSNNEVVWSSWRD